MASPTFVGIDTQAVKEATKNNHKNTTKSSFDDSLYSAISYGSATMGPALSASAAYAHGSGSESAMIVDAAVNAAAGGGANMASFTGSPSFMTDSAGMGMANLATGGSPMFMGDPTSAGGMSGDYSSMMADMQASNTMMIAMQAQVGQETTRTNTLTNVMSSKYQTLRTIANKLGQ